MYIYSERSVFISILFNRRSSSIARGIGSIGVYVQKTTNNEEKPLLLLLQFVPASSPVSPRDWVLGSRHGA